MNRRINEFLDDTQHGETWSDNRTLVVIPGAYELIEIAELIKEGTNGNAIIETDKNSMNCLIETKNKLQLTLT